MSESSQRSRTFRRWGMGVAMLLTVATMGGCDRLLEVNLPANITDEALTSPSTAHVQVNSVIALLECAYGGLAIDAAGYEDNFQRVTGVAGLYSEYETSPGGGCSGNYASGWDGNIFSARGYGYAAYDRIDNWSQATIQAANGLGAYGSRQELLGVVALYTGLTLGIAGEHFCEFVISTETQLGPLMTYSETLDLAEEWLDTAIGHIQTAGDFDITLASGTITSSALTMAYGLRARARWANGDLAGAAADAALVPDGFYAYVLREDVVEGTRTNNVGSMQSGAGGVQAAGFLQGPIREKTNAIPYGISFIGNQPPCNGGGPGNCTGPKWPDPIPFTGYVDLGMVQATGRAVDDNGNAVTTDAAGTVADPRIPTGIGNTAGGDLTIPKKYTSLGDDIPLVSWVEMRLIRAEAAGSTQAAIDHVNAVRHGSVYIGGTLVDIDLPNATYVAAGNANGIRNLIIEERRRGLFEEGRFWSTKILNTDKLWFPRDEGQWLQDFTGSTYNLLGGVRVLLPGNEYDLNLGLDARGTGCPIDQAPVFL